MPKVSIITASYNYDKYIKETIDSVIAQTFQDWEMIIVDDGSKDNSVEVIKSYCQKDARVKFFQHENGENKGLAETLQTGIKNAQSEWIVFLESDDTIVPTYLAEKFDVIKKYPEVDFVFNDVNMFGETEIIKKYEKIYFHIIYPIINKIKYPSTMFGAFRKFESGYNMISTFSVVMLRKDLLTGIDFVSPVKAWLDWYIWLQIVGKKKYKFFYINKKLTNWRMHNNSYINDNKMVLDRNFIFFKIKKSIILSDFVSLLKVLYEIVLLLKKKFFNFGKI